MDKVFRNIRYFYKEIKTILRLDLVSNIFSVFSLGFIFFLLSLIISGGWIVNDMIEGIENEAEISIYYVADFNPLELAEEIKIIQGVKEINLIDQLQAKERMTDIMGEESRIIELFDHNPFSPYIEVKIDLNLVDTVISEANSINGVELVRDNKDVLERLKSISSLTNILTILVIVAVSVATFVITSHIIRQGIYMNREQINTLRLLGAPEYFINLPFILEGIFITLLAAIISIGLVFVIVNYIYSKISTSLPFIILPNMMNMLIRIGFANIVISLILGLLGSFFGLKSTMERKGI